MLADTGSLTDRFKQMMQVTPHLTLLNQGREMVSWRERQILSIKPRQMALVREIKMGYQQKNWLFARTIIPAQTLIGSARRLIHLKTKPMGKVLFGRHGAKRTQMEIFRTSQLPEKLSFLDIESEVSLWQRNSIFEFSSGPIMITEVFLPDCPFYNNKES